MISLPARLAHSLQEPPKRDIEGGHGREDSLQVMWRMQPDNSRTTEAGPRPTSRLAGDQGNTLGPMFIFPRGL